MLPLLLVEAEELFQSDDAKHLNEMFISVYLDSNSSVSWREFH